MKKVGLVSNDMWMNKISEDKNLKYELIKRGIDAEIVSWQSSDIDDFQLLVLRSAWGYQNDFKNFKNWLSYLDKKNIKLENNTKMILSNVLKDKQFDILDKNNIKHIDTYFIDNKNFDKEIYDFKNYNIPIVFKPTISGSGENTFLYDSSKKLVLPNTLSIENIKEKLNKLLLENKDSNVMVQPYISSINDGEYSCIFIDGILTHTMKRFPAVFHSKKKPYLVKDVPSEIEEVARKVESLDEFNNYLYMRVDMVLDKGHAKVMEVELAEPDLLTKYIGNKSLERDVIRTFAKKIEKRIK